MNHRFVAATATALLGLAFATSLAAAVPVDTVHVDLNHLIDAAFRSPEQFAVRVAHAVSTDRQGSWSQRGSVSTWTYSTRIPTAISLSFHASGVSLPPSAVLTVSTERASVNYSARDVARSGLWGRPLPGESLNFSLSVSAPEAGRVRLQIESFQAGYRSLGGGVPDHPHYAALRRQAAAATSGCTENYACNATSANQGPSRATVALIIGNLYQCTGTLLNDTNADGIPYVATARHCESGQLGGGDPDAAATVGVYWDAITACGTPLGSIYDTGIVNQYGASTVLEQQDLWLLQLDAPPAPANVYYAGWDASGTPVSGGYTIHDALGGDQQYVAWNGTAVLEQIPAATFGIGYDSTFWGVVNALGNLGAGASGSALFNPNNQVVGSASLGALTNGANTAGICPAQPPPAPSASTATALFTALSGVWSAATDRTSSTGSRTLQSVLDPGNTGQLSTPGIATQPITVTASNSAPTTGDPVTLTWAATGATSCTAYGGTSGDGWAGTQAASGSLQLTSAVGGPVTYSLECRSGGNLGAGSATVSWAYLAPTTGLSGSAIYPLALGAQRQANWNANVQPCVASGGVPGDGWAGPQPVSGTRVLTISQVGVTQYTLTCGAGSRVATDSFYIDGAAPDVTLLASAQQVTTGTAFDLSWLSFGTGPSCSATGGSGMDTWLTGFGAEAGASAGTVSVSESTPGSYTYTVTCTGGGQSATSSQTVTVTSGPPAVSLTAVAPTLPVYQSGAGNYPPLDLLWNASGQNCLIEYTSNSGQPGSFILGGLGGSGAVTAVETSPGAVTYTLTCGTQMASATINWVASAPASALTASSATWAAGAPYTLSWNAAAGPCVAGGGGAGDGWSGAKNPTGTQTLTESLPGGYLFTLSCGSGAGATTSSVIVEVPLPGIQINALTNINGATLLPYTTIQWSSTVGPCTYLDGSMPGSVAVPVAPSGSVTPAPAVSGTYLFTLSCGNPAHPISAATLADIVLSVPTTLTSSTTTADVDGPVTLTWNSAGNAICYATGGDGSAPWSGVLPGTGSGSLIVTSRSVGTVTYGISCNNTAEVSVDYVAVPATSASVATPAVSLSTSTAKQVAGQGVTLSWTADHVSGCTAEGGNPGDGWSGPLAASGSMTVSEATAGSVTYSIVCTGAPPAATASALVVIVAAESPPAGASSHGGGSMDGLLLVLLGLSVGISRGRRRA